MWTISGYGDSLYNLTKNVTKRCALTSGATQIMLEQLKITEETYMLVMRAITASKQDVKSVQPVEHPLKYVCRRVAKSYAEKPHLSTAFSLAKLIARSSPTEGRPAYSDSLIGSLPQMGKLLDSWATIPELARAMANSGFRNQLNESKAYTTRHHLLVKSVFQIVHKDDEFANMMQDVYERMLTKIMPQITTNATATALTLSDGKTFWFFPRMMKMFYHTLKEDDILMGELNNTAAIVGKNYDKTYIDFSQI
ncbi:hypothetical protein V9T40_000419 [Parthenolecanium corni]|uniref:Uncharacterized protein n=1 Tax=Parthenolecanium corni TaxID=536013 RepID=A0AAN9Y1L2_9HEMI